jgi:ADP-ribosylglycohydrolase
MKNAIFLDVTPVALVRTDVLEELSASIIMVTRITHYEERASVASYG